MTRDPEMAWLRMQSCPEGSVERRFASLMRSEGGTFLKRRLRIDQATFDAWVEAMKVPDDRVDEVERLFAELTVVEDDVEADLGEEARRLTEDQGLTQAEAGRILGITPQAVSKRLAARRRA